MNIVKKAFRVWGISLRDKVGILHGADKPATQDDGTIPTGSLYLQHAYGLWQKLTFGWRPLPQMRELIATDNSKVPFLMMADPNQVDRMISIDTERFEFHEATLREDEFLTDGVGLVRFTMPFDGVIFAATLEADSVSKNARTVAMLVNGNPAGSLTLDVQSTYQYQARFDLNLEFKAGDVIEARDITQAARNAKNVNGVIRVRWCLEE